MSIFADLEKGGICLDCDERGSMVLKFNSSFVFIFVWGLRELVRNFRIDDNRHKGIDTIDDRG